MSQRPMLEVATPVPGPHGGRPVLLAGTPPEQATSAMIMVHGRGGSAADILALRYEWKVAQMSFVAPEAAGSTWYPSRFVAPLEDNEPHLTSALALLAAVVGELERRGLPSERQVLLGFSQGGCLALEFAARNARRWRGVVGLSAGLIGPPGHQWRLSGSLDGTPVVLGCSDVDPHIPIERVQETASVLGRIGGRVDLAVYPGMGHTINRDEIKRVRHLLAGPPAPPPF